MFGSFHLFELFIECVASNAFHFLQLNGIVSLGICECDYTVLVFLVIGNSKQSSLYFR